MSDDPRGYRGYSGNQRHTGPQGRDVDPRGGGRGDARTAQRGYSHIEPAGNSVKQASFSAFRPEAYAGGDKRSPQGAASGQGRQDWNDSGRSAPAQRAQAPGNDMYPRQAPERAAPQRDYRDPYSNAYSNAPADPYSVQHKGVQQEYASDWQQPGYRDNNQYSNSYYDPAPQLSEAQAVHDRFFSGGNEPDHGAGARYQNAGYADPDLPPPPLHDDGYNGHAAPRGGYGAGNQDYYDNFDQDPAPQSLRPQLPALARVDDHDADYFADEDEFETDDFPEERRGGSKRLIAAVLIGAVITGGGLAFLYRTSGHGDAGAPKMVEADARPVKGVPEETSGPKFQAGNKSIQDRLGGDAAEAADAGDAPADNTGSASTESQETASVTGGTLEERIQSALRNAKKSAPGDEASGNADAPRTVQTVKVRPDGTFEAPQAQIVMPPQSTSASSVGEAPQGVVVTSMGSNSRSVTAPASKVAQAEKVAPAPKIAQSEPAEEMSPPAETPPTRPAAAPQRPVNVAMLSTPPAVQTGSTGGIFVQIAARQEQDQAMAAFATLQQKYASVLGNHTPSVRKVDLAEKGTWYRLWVGPMGSKAEADKLCGDLMAAGLKNCLVRSE